MVDETGVAKSKQMPKGGRKGGVQFPHLSLEKALLYSKKLVSKTHTGALPSDSILAGVFGAGGGRGQVRVGALKQYGLLEGPATAYKATELAKIIDAAVPDERSELLKQALTKPKVFRELLQTFHSDSVSKAKIEQRIKVLGVHPDSAEECARLFIESIVTAEAGKVDGENVTLGSMSANPMTQDPQNQDEDIGESEEDDVETEAPVWDAIEGTEEPGEPVIPVSQISRKHTGQAQVNLSLNVDSSSDPDKLERQLKLLRKFGML